MQSIPTVLCYHKIERRRELGVTRISPQRFRKQVERLATAGFRSLGVDELLQRVSGEREAGEREIAFTFDDAYRGLREHAFPVLEAHGFTGICFVITDYAGTLNRWDVAYGGRRFAHLAWRDISRWAARGIQFGSHTCTHPRLTWLDEPAIARELAESRRVIEAELGQSPSCRAVAFPFGAAGDRERRLAREAGYRLGLNLAGSWIGDPMAVPRQPVYSWSPPVPGVGPARWLERAVACATNRCAVGTSLWLAVTGQNRAGGRAEAPVPVAGD